MWRVIRLATVTPQYQLSPPPLQTHNTSQLSQTVWRISLCGFLFSLALFATTLLGKVLGRHFYNTAHFNKVNTRVGAEGVFDGYLLFY